MMLVPLITALLCACAHYVTGLGLVGVGYPMVMGGMGHGMMGMGMGHSGMDDSGNGDQFLTCSNREFDANGGLLFAVAVTVKDDDDSSSRGGMWGMHGGMNGWWNQGRSNRPRGGLSAQIELYNDVSSGLGLVAFTQRAQPENLCALDGKADFGPNLLGSEDDDSDDFSTFGMGHGGMMYGGYGFGMGYGMGMGMGYPGMIDYSMLDYETEDGVVAELPIVRRQISTLTVDGLPFRDLSDLAGRGLVICPSVKITSNSQYVCEKPFYACCQLRFDSQSSKLNI